VTRYENLEAAVYHVVGGLLLVGEVDSHFIPGGCWQHLFVLDDSGQLLDSLTCEISTRLVSRDGANYQTTVLEETQPDGARIVISYLPDEGTVGGNFGHEITHAGKTYRYYWGGEEMSKEPSEWHVKGLCRLAVRDGKLQILFPDPAKAAEVR
jgi:hypothetical protein